jgi:hypothetical protein
MMMVLLRTARLPCFPAISQIRRGQYRSADSIETMNDERVLALC